MSPDGCDRGEHCSDRDGDNTEYSRGQPGQRATSSKRMIDGEDDEPARRDQGETPPWRVVSDDENSRKMDN